MSFSEPTPVQEQIIPLALTGVDCLAQAPTGTGKTCAFGIPLVEMSDKGDPLVQSLVLCPTRELAMQTERELKKLALNCGVKVLAIFGGQNIDRQLAGLRKKPQIVVGTPGRVLDHLNRRTLKLHGIKRVVLDEADEMLDMGFRDDIDEIISCMPSRRQTMLFSATLADDILDISRSYQTEPASVKTTIDNKELPPVNQYYVLLEEKKKYDCLKALFERFNYQNAIIFCNTKRRVDEVAASLAADGFTAKGLHGDLRQRVRDTIMRDYRSGGVKFLVATDVAARGIDVNGVEAVINYDLPLDDDYYIHRIGRTARCGKGGDSISFATKRDRLRLKEYEKLTKTPIEEMSLAEYSLKSIQDTPADSLRFFINLGTKDDVNENGIRGFVSSISGIAIENIYSVKLLELFGFIEVKASEAEKLSAVTGSRYGKRLVSVELAGDRGAKGGKSSSRSPQKRNDRFAPRGRTTEAPRGASGNRPTSGRQGGSRPSGERASSARPFGERTPSTRPSEERSSSAQGNRSGSNAERFSRAPIERTNARPQRPAYQRDGGGARFAKSEDAKEGTRFTSPRGSEVPRAAQKAQPTDGRKDRKAYGGNSSRGGRGVNFHDDNFLPKAEREGTGHRYAMTVSNKPQSGASAADSVPRLKSAGAKRGVKGDRTAPTRRG